MRAKIKKGGGREPFVPFHLRPKPRGRPALPLHRQRQHLHCRIDPWLMQHVRSISDQENVQLTGVVESALEVWLAGRGILRESRKRRRRA